MRLIKPLIAIAVMGATTSALASNPFSGLYFGAGGGIRDTWITSTWNNTLVNSGTLNFSGSYRGSDLQLANNLMVGYGFNVGSNYYVSPELSAIVNDSNAVNVWSLPQTNDGGTFTYQNQAEINEQFSLGVKLGSYLTQNDLVYIKPAFTYGELEASQSIVQAGSSNIYQSMSVKKYIPGAQIGVGYSHAFNQSFAVQGELNYAQFESYNLGGTDFKPAQFLASVTAVFKF